MRSTVVFLFLFLYNAVCTVLYQSSLKPALSSSQYLLIDSHAARTLIVHAWVNDPATDRQIDQ